MARAQDVQPRVLYCQIGLLTDDLLAVYDVDLARSHLVDTLSTEVEDGASGNHIIHDGFNASALRNGETDAVEVDSAIGIGDVSSAGLNVGLMYLEDLLGSTFNLYLDIAFIEQTIVDLSLVLSNDESANRRAGS